MKYVFIFLIYAYRAAISPLLGSCCRFEPTCSAYALEAFQRLGSRKGLILTLKRLGKCHPLHPGGEDPVPK